MLDSIAILLIRLRNILSGFRCVNVMFGKIGRALNYCSRRKPPEVLVIGAQKSGTSAVYEYLSKHPQLVPSSVKEINYFSCNCRYSQGTQFYHSHFPRVLSSKILPFEASPSYLHNDVAYKRIYSYNPNIKLIAILRNPIERAYSAWNMYRQRYQINREWFFKDWAQYCDGNGKVYARRNDAALFNFKDFILNELDEAGKGVPNFIESPVLSHGLYYTQLMRFMSLFNRDQLMIIYSNELKHSTFSTLRVIEEWLGINFFDWPEEITKPVFGGVYIGSIDGESKSLLEDYYAEDNKHLIQLTGKNHDWESV